MQKSPESNSKKYYLSNTDSNLYKCMHPINYFKPTVDHPPIVSSGLYEENNVALQFMNVRKSESLNRPNERSISASDRYEAHIRLQSLHRSLEFNYETAYPSTPSSGMSEVFTREETDTNGTNFYFPLNIHTECNNISSLPQQSLTQNTSPRKQRESDCFTETKQDVIDVDSDNNFMHLSSKCNNITQRKNNKGQKCSVIGNKNISITNTEHNFGVATNLPSQNENMRYLHGDNVEIVVHSDSSLPINAQPEFNNFKQNSKEIIIQKKPYITTLDLWQKTNTHGFSETEKITKEVNPNKADYFTFQTASGSDINDRSSENNYGFSNNNKSSTNNKINKVTSTLSNIYLDVSNSSPDVITGSASSRSMPSGYVSITTPHHHPIRRSTSACHNYSACKSRIIDVNKAACKDFNPNSAKQCIIKSDKTWQGEFDNCFHQPARPATYIKKRYNQNANDSCITRETLSEPIARTFANIVLDYNSSDNDSESGSRKSLPDVHKDDLAYRSIVQSGRSDIPENITSHNLGFRRQIRTFEGGKSNWWPYARVKCLKQFTEEDDSRHGYSNIRNKKVFVISQTRVQ